MHELKTTSLIEALNDESGNLYCRNMKLVAERIIENYPEDQHIELHQIFASICFYLKIGNEAHRLLETINIKKYSEEGYIQENLYRYLIQYFSSMDSILDLLEKASIKLDLNSVRRFDRSQLKYNPILNTIRNFLMHDGIPFCRVGKNKTVGSVSTCADIAEYIEDNVSFSLDLIFNSEKLLVDTFSLEYLVNLYQQFKRDIEIYLNSLLKDEKMA